MGKAVQRSRRAGFYAFQKRRYPALSSDIYRYMLSRLDVGARRQDHKSAKARVKVCDLNPSWGQRNPTAGASLLSGKRFLLREPEGIGGFTHK